MRSDAVRDAERILAQEGVMARVAAAGHDGSVARIVAPPTAWPRLLGEPGRAVAERIRALGFRYVTIDLDCANGDQIDDET